VRRMNPHLQPRISLVLRRAHRVCLALVRMQYGGAIHTLRCAAPRPFSLPQATEAQAP
jgi:hypothetical protein